MAFVMKYWRRKKNSQTEWWKSEDDSTPPENDTVDVSTNCEKDYCRTQELSKNDTLAEKDQNEVTQELELSKKEDSMEIPNNEKEQSERTQELDSEPSNSCMINRPPTFDSQNTILVHQSVTQIWNNSSANDFHNSLDERKPTSEHLSSGYEGSSPNCDESLSDNEESSPKLTTCVSKPLIERKRKNEDSEEELVSMKKRNITLLPLKPRMRLWPAHLWRPYPSLKYPDPPMYFTSSPETSDYEDYEDETDTEDSSPSNHETPTPEENFESPASEFYAKRESSSDSDN